jgi:deoxycytidylate deaminase
MKDALAFARAAGACGEVPVGALVVSDGRVVGTGLTGAKRDKVLSLMRKLRRLKKPPAGSAVGG